MRNPRRQYDGEVDVAITGNNTWILNTVGRDPAERAEVCAHVLEVTATADTAGHTPDLAAAWHWFDDQLAQQETIARLLRWKQWVLGGRAAA